MKITTLLTVFGLSLGFGVSFGATAAVAKPQNVASTAQIPAAAAKPQKAPTTAEIVNFGASVAANPQNAASTAQIPAAAYAGAVPSNATCTFWNHTKDLSKGFKEYWKTIGLEKYVNAAKAKKQSPQMIQQGEKQVPALVKKMFNNGQVWPFGTTFNGVNWSESGQAKGGFFGYKLIKNPGRLAYLMTIAGQDKKNKNLYHIYLNAMSMAGSKSQFDMNDRFFLGVCRTP